MAHIRIHRAMRWTAATALASTVLIGATGAPVGAASEGQYANAWTSPDPVLWFPLPPASPNPLGPTEASALCVEGSSQPGGAIAFFTFGTFSIPAGNVIKGIEVRPRYRTNGHHFLQLTDSGVLIGVEKDLPLNFPGVSNCDSTSVVPVGGATDLWGTAGLTPADFNAGDIGVRVRERTGEGTDGGSIPLALESIQLVVHHGPANTPPTADAGGPYTVNEGGSVALDGSGSSDPDLDTLTYAWDLDNDGAFDDATGVAPTFSAAGRDGPDTQTIRVKVNDGTVDSAPDTATVTIDNVAPSITAINLSAASIDEGQSVTVSGTFTDPAVLLETHTGTAVWSDGTSTPLTVGDGTFSTTRAFPDDHPSTGTASDGFTVTISIDDGDGGVDSDTSAAVTVHNLAPSVDSTTLSASPIDEDGTVTVSGSFTDAGLPDTHTVTIDWGDGSSGPATVVQAPGSGTFSAMHQYLDDDPTATPQDTYTITATVTDDDTGADSGTVDLIVNNVAPVVTSFASDATFADKAEEGELVTVNGAFTDVGTLDTHTATVDWGDGTVTPATVVQAAGGGTVTAGHAYSSGGVYTVVVTVADDDTGSASSPTTAVVTGVGINGGVLQVVGTNGDDHVEVQRIQGEIDVFASFVSPNHRRYDLAAVTSIEMWLCDGDDHGDIHPSIELPASIHGGADDDMLWGGSGPDFVEGGDGDDMIWGRVGDDTLHGDAGDDRITGGSGTDVLDGGPGINVLKQ